MADLAILFDPTRQQWLRFVDLIEVHEIRDLAEVLPCLGRIEERVARDQIYAAGLVSYEAAAACDPALVTDCDPDFPLLRFGLFRHCEPMELTVPEREPILLDWQPKIDRDSFRRAINLIHDAIACGATYQVNLTFPLHAPFEAEPWSFFRQLVHGQQAGGAGYLEAGRWTICSASPELFFRRAGQTLTMRPMKGTAPRGRTLAEDQLFARRLRTSVKDRAENIMILDMVRNDLGRIAQPGTVQTEQLCTLEKYPTLWQMTSTATARSQASLPEIFAALFPCASITGAPKARTMRIIHDLEARPRNIYTGSFGWLEPDGTAHFNVAIRTVLVDRWQHQASYGVGAGITWDSRAQQEYRECLTKALVLNQPRTEFSLIETLRWSPFKGYFLLAQHLMRLRDSCRYFDFSVCEQQVQEHLLQLARTLPPVPHKIRLLAHRDGRIEHQVSPLSAAAHRQPLRLKLAGQAIDDTDVFLFHKTTRRQIYEGFLANRQDCDDVLLWNRRGQITECCTGNLVAEVAGRLVTPRLDCGLLPGTYRAYLLDKGVLSEQTLTSPDLQRATRLFLINAVRKFCPAVLLD